MAGTGLSVRTWTPHGIVLPQSRRWIAYALVVGLVIVVGLAVIGSRCGPCGKIDANRIASPWDHSLAPPAYVKRAEVRIVNMQRDQASLASSTRPEPLRRH